MNMRDIPKFREATIEWSRVCPLLALVSFCVSHSPRQDNVVKNMIPAETNKEVAGYTMAEPLPAVPIRFGLRSFAARVALCLLEDRVRVGMMYVFPKTARRSPIQYSPQATCSPMVLPCLNAWCHGNKLDCTTLVPPSQDIPLFSSQD